MMKAEERRDLYMAVFTGQEGMKVLEDLKRRCRFKESSFNTDALKMARDEGVKDLVRYIEKQIEAK